MTSLPRPTFSIIIPTFNVGAKLSQTLDSILAQDTDFEVLITDGASGDDTLALARQYAANDARVQVHSEPDLGLYDAMNKGIRLARGRYLYFIGVGDTVRPGVLPQIAAHLPEGEKAVVYGNVFWVDAGVPYGDRFGKWQIARRNVPHQGAFYGRDIFDLVEGYDLRYRTLADHAFNIRLWGDTRIERHYVDLIVADYEGGGLSAQIEDEVFFRNRTWLVRKHLGAPVAFGLRFFQRFPGLEPRLAQAVSLWRARRGGAGSR